MRPKDSLKVLGVDPGTRVTGWGLVEAGEGVVVRVEWGCLRAKASSQRPKMLAELAEGLRQVVALWQPQVIAMETPFVSGFPRASLQLAETRGALLAVLGDYQGVVAEYEPARVKAWVVGHGRADKSQVAWVVRHFLQLKDEPPADAADALAVALCHLFQHGLRAGFMVGAQAGLAH